MQRPTVSTAGGDKGKSSLYGGQRVSKADARLHAYGTVDEMNAVLGLVLAEDKLPDDLRSQLKQIQKDLFCLGADLSTPLEKTGGHIVRIEEGNILRLELWGVEMEAKLPPLERFILPGGCRAAALLHLARTMCRRAERWMVHCNEMEALNNHALIYVNRLSDYFFLASRMVNVHAGTKEEEWIPKD